MQGCLWGGGNGGEDAFLQTSSVPLRTANGGMWLVLTANTLLNKASTKPRCCTENPVCHVRSTETWAFPYFLWNKLQISSSCSIRTLRSKLMVSSQCSMQEAAYFTCSEWCSQWIVLLDWFTINKSAWQAENEKAISQCWKQTWSPIKLFLYYPERREGLILIWGCWLSTYLFFAHWQQVSGVLTGTTNKHENNNKVLHKYLVFCWVAIDRIIPRTPQTSEEFSTVPGFFPAPLTLI